MSKFHYEWWTVQIKELTGEITLEIKAKSREHAVRQIEKAVTESNSEENKSRPWFERKTPILAVYWDTLTLDRVGYQRLS